MEVSDELKAFLKETMDTAVSSAVNTAVSTVAKQQQALHESFQKEVNTKFETLAPKEEPEEKLVLDNTEGQNTANAQLLRQIEKMQKDLAAEKEGRASAEEARKRESLLNAAKEQLGNAGVQSDRIAHAMAYLNDSKRLFEFTDQKEPGMKVATEYGETQIVPLAKGIETWIKTDEAQLYLPPVSAQGTGEHLRGSDASNGRRGNTISRADLARQLINSRS